MKYLLLFIFLPLVGISQQVNLMVSVFEDGAALEGATVDVVNHGQVLVSETTTNTGQIALIVPLGYDYMIKFSKDGYVSQMAHFDGQAPGGKQLPDFVNHQIEMEVFQNCEAGEYSFLSEEPVVGFRFDSTMNVISDDQYKHQMDLKISSAHYANLSEEEKDKFIESYYKGQELMEFYKFDEALPHLEKAKNIKDCGRVNKAIESCKIEAKIQAEYDQRIKEADALFEDKKYKEALEKYKNAISMRPQEMYPQDKAKAIEDILNK